MGREEIIGSTVFQLQLYPLPLLVVVLLNFLSNTSANRTLGGDLLGKKKMGG